MADLTTLANVKAWLALEVSTDDALLTRLISACSTYLQTWMGRNIAVQSYTEIRNGHGGCQLSFADYPVLTVSQVSVNGQIIPAQSSFYGAGYRFDNQSIVLTGYRFERGRQNVLLSYSAGFATTPPELEQAVIELIALRYKERDRIGYSSKSLAGETVSFIVKDFPDSVRTIINNYKKVVPL